MPILSRRAFVKKQQRRQKLEQMKKIRKAINAGVVMFSTAALSQVATKTTPVTAQTLEANATTSKTFSKSEFLGLVSENARQIAAANDLYASVMIAQAVLESGWGNSALSQAPYYNLFGIKGSSSDNTVAKKTLEDDGTGTYHEEVANFKRYDNYAGSLNDYASVLTANNDPSNWRYNYYLGARVSQTNSYLDATAHLTGRYATDTTYASKLNAIIEQNNLTAFDTLNRSAAVTTTTTTTTAQPVAGGGNYTVVAGDTYWSLAKKYGVSVTQLQQLNNATNGNLSVGQVLVVPSTNTSAVTVETVTTTTAPTTTVRTVTSSVSALATSQVTGNYTVVAGDTYWSLSKRFGVSVAELQQLNGATNASLNVGQSLKVPSALAVSSANNEGTTVTTTPVSTVVTQSSPTEAAVSNSTGNYTVVAGDSYWAIARRLGVSVNELMVANNSQSLHPGQKIVVPGSTVTTTAINSGNTSNSPSTTSSQSSPTSITVTTTTGNYTVVSGDSLYAIARRHNMSVAQLMQANGLNESSVIHPGQQLVVSGAVSTTTGVAAQPVVTTTTTTVETEQPIVQSQPTVNETVTNSGTYTVVAGDTLYSIAKRHGLNVDTLVANNGGSTSISVGQIIKF